MEQYGTYATATEETASPEPAGSASVVVDLDELRRMRAEIIAVKASVDHLLQIVIALTASAEVPADRN